jgi:hypothetical protein
MPSAARWRGYRQGRHPVSRVEQPQRPGRACNPRQADRILYKAAVREILENQPNLWIFQQAADD